MFNERISEMDSPCYDRKTKTDCPRRCVGCAENCPEWADYVKRRDEHYKERMRRQEIKSILRAMPAKRMEDSIKQKIKYGRIKSIRS
jgi:hypothetical protein